VQLLATEAEHVPRDVAATFREICASTPAVAAGFACKQQVTIDGEPAGERLALAVHIDAARRSPDEKIQVMGAFAQAFPHEGLAFLEDIALPAWRDLGVQLY
jgi:hypothetical protein